jgi:uncharacterized protein (DUF4415 family)
MSAKRKSIISDLKRLDNMRDTAIDYSDIPPLDDSFFERATVKLPQKKDVVTLRVDHAVLEFYKHQGKGYQTLMNGVLKMYAESNAKQKLLKKRHQATGK